MVARALVLHDGSSGAAVHPADTTVGSWFEHGSCVAVGPDMVLTTRHQGGGVNSPVAFGGKGYQVVEVFNHHEADLRLARVVPTGSGGALDAVDLYVTSLDPVWKNETAYDAVLGGYGRGRGGDLYEGPIHYGYTWADGINDTLRWGANDVEATGTVQDAKYGYTSRVLVADFDPPGGLAAETAPAEFDSGGGWFLNLGTTADPEWYLAGLTRGVARQEESWFRQPSGSPPGDSMDAVRVSQYAAWADAVLHPHEWITDGDGTWFNAANWSTTVPDDAERWAVFGDVITAPRTVTLDHQVEIGTLRIDSGQPYRFTDGIEDPHWLVFDSDEDVARIEVNRLNKSGGHGAHRIETTLWLRSPLLVNQRSDGELTLAGTVTGNGSITKRGGGTLVLKADNAGILSSEHLVEQGVLCAAHPGALGTGKVWLVGGDLCLRGDADALFPNQVEATAPAGLHVEPDTGGAGVRLALGEFKAVGGLDVDVTGSDGYRLAVAGWTRFTQGPGSVSTVNTASADLALEGPVQVTGGTLRKTGSAALVFEATGPGDLDFWEDTALQVQGGTARLHGDAGAVDRRNLAVSVEGGTVEFDATQHLASLHVSDGTAACLQDGTRTLVTGHLAFDEPGGAPAGRLDLADNNLAVDDAGSGPNDALYDEVAGWVADASNGGAWDGNGITSTLAGSGVYALGVLDNGDPPDGVAQLTTLDGEDLVDLVGDLDCVIVRYTYYGDADVDGMVDFDDVQRLIASYNTPPADPRWAEADFNYDHTVNFTDVQLLIAGWNNQGAPLDGGGALSHLDRADGGAGPAQASADAGLVEAVRLDPVGIDTAALDETVSLPAPAGCVVPEPGTLLLAAAGALAVLARRRDAARRRPA